MMYTHTLRRPAVGDRILEGMRLTSRAWLAAGTLLLLGACAEASPDRRHADGRDQPTTSRPISCRATMSFITSAVPSPISSPMTSRSRCSNGSSSV